MTIEKEQIKKKSKRSYRIKQSKEDSEIVVSASNYFAFDKLPSEVKLIIFQYLDMYDLFVTCVVSKKWRDLSYDKTLWTQLDLGIFKGENVNYDKLAGQWSSRLKSLKIVEVSRNLLTINQILVAFGPHFTGLETLNVHACGRLSSETIEFIGPYLRNLKILIAASWIGGSFLRGVDSHMGHLGNEAIRSFSSTKSLVTVDITGWSISDYGITMLAKNNPNLKNLNISYCYNITDAGIQMLVSKCPELEVIDVSEVLCDNGLLAFSKLQNLKTLVALSSKVTSKGIIEFLKSGTSVEDLMIGECKNVKEKKIWKFIDKNSQIKINLHFGSDAAIDLDETVWSYIYPSND